MKVETAAWVLACSVSVGVSLSSTNGTEGPGDMTGFALSGVGAIP